MNPMDVARNLMFLGRQLDSLTKELLDLGVAEAEARRTYETVKARAVLAAEGSTVDARNAQAVLLAADAKYDLNVAEVKTKTCQSALRAVHARIDIGRTLASNVRAEITLDGAGMHP